MRAGAADYIEKPVSREKLLPVLERLLTSAVGERSLESDEGSRFGMVGRSEAMRRIFQLVDMAAPTRCRVFICGESARRLNRHDDQRIVFDEIAGVLLTSLAVVERSLFAFAFRPETPAFSGRPLPFG